MLFLIGLALLSIAIMADIASATTLARLKFEDLASQASAVGRMRCVRTESHWKNGEIWTRTEFIVVEQNKGSLPQIVEVEMPGGIIGHLHARVEEVPAFTPGEDAYLFLWSAPNGTYRILGWSQGAFRIRKDSTAGVELVTQDSADAPLFNPITRQFRHGGVRNLPVATFQLKLKRAFEHQ
jgi:hypothetical protein